MSKRKQQWSAEAVARSAMLTKEDWQRCAEAMARVAHTKYFPSRWGSIEDSKLGVLIIFNNCPYLNYPKGRDEQLAEFRHRIKDMKVEEMAYGTYGEDGYTYALILQASPDLYDELEDLMSQCLRSPMSEEIEPIPESAK